MRSLLPSVLLLLAATVVGAPPAVAQETGMVGDLERVLAMTPDEARSYAERSVDTLQRTVDALTDRIKATNQSKDATEVACLTSKLTAALALLEVGQAARDGVQQDDLARARSDLRRLAIARSKSEQLLAEAELCTGEGPSGQTIEVLSEPGGDDRDSLDPFSEGTDWSPSDPPEASPFR